MLSKFITLFFIFINSYLVAGGGLTIAETNSAFTLIIPLFTVYLSVIFKDIMSNPYVDNEKKVKVKKRKKVKGSIKLFTYLLLPLYVASIIYIINRTTAGDFDISQMQWALGSVEGILGIYIGQIIFALFKKEE